MKVIIINNDEKHRAVIQLEDIGANVVSVNVYVDGEDVTLNPDCIFDIEESPSMKILLELLEIISRRLEE